MITLVEALNYRCLRYVSRPLLFRRQGQRLELDDWFPTEKQS